MGRKPKGGGNDERRIRLDDEQIRLWFTAGKTAAEIAALVGCSTHPIKQALRRLNLRRAAKRRPGVGSGSGNTAWKGGRRTRTDGYVLVWTPEGERLEHRVVMEAVLGRSLRPGEVIHHRNGNKQDNSPGNLQIMTQAEHAAHHAPNMHKARYGR